MTVSIENVFVDFNATVLLKSYVDTIEVCKKIISFMPAGFERQGESHDLVGD